METELQFLLVEGTLVCWLQVHVANSKYQGSSLSETFKYCLESCTICVLVKEFHAMLLANQTSCKRFTVYITGLVLKFRTIKLPNNVRNIYLTNLPSTYFKTYCFLNLC